MNETELKTQPAPASAEPAVSVPEKSEETVSESTAQQLLSSAKIQEKCAKKSLLHQRIRTVLAVIVAVAALSMHDVQLLTNNASYAVTNLTNTVNELDLKKTLAAIDDMVQDGTVLIDQGNTMIRNSSQDIETSLKAIAGLDIEGLNESIQALESVTTSIGKLFGYKGK